MNNPFFIPPDMATLFYVNQFMDRNPRATYDDVMRWVHNDLHERFMWAVVTPDIETRIFARLYAGKACDA